MTLIGNFGKQAAVLFLVAVVCFSVTKLSAQEFGVKEQALLFFERPNFPQSDSEVAIGRDLFSRSFVSSDGSLKSCADCHSQNATLSGSSPPSMNFVTRSAPSLKNLVWRKKFGWEQARGLHELINAALTEEMRVAVVPEDVKDQFSCETDRECIETIVNYLSKYVLSRISTNSRFDQFLFGNDESLTEIEKLGMELFTGRAGCTSCHKTIGDFSTFSDNAIHNIGLKVMAGDHGRCLMIKGEELCNFFATPTLRDVEFSAPYMHDGRFDTLSEVINFYNLGGDDGIRGKDSKIRKLGLSLTDKRALEAYLLTLSGSVVE